MVAVALLLLYVPQTRKLSPPDRPMGPIARVPAVARAPRTRAKLVPSALWTSGVSTGARGRGAGAAGAAATRMWMGTGGVADTTCYTLAVNRQKERRLGRGEAAPA